MDEIRTGATAEISFPGERICHPVSGFILGCIDAEMFKVCWKTQINKLITFIYSFQNCPTLQPSTECSQLQSYAQNCFIPPQSSRTGGNNLIRTPINTTRLN